MISLKKLRLKKRDIERYLYEIDKVDNVMEHIGGLFVLDRRNNSITESIVKQIELPKKITHLQLQVLPSENTKFYFSFSGIEIIIFNLFINLNKKRIIDDLKECETYFKVYYKKDEMYNIPVICIEFIFLKKLLTETINYLWKKLKEDIFYFTGDYGNIDVVEINTINNLSKLLSIPILVGCPEFKKEGILKKYNFTNEQINEMNNIHGLPIMNLKMNSIINNSNLTLFDEYREIIKKYGTIGDSDTIKDDEVNDVFYQLFGTNDKDKIKDTILDDYIKDNLPF